MQLPSLKSLIKKGIHYGLIGLSGVAVNLLIFHIVYFVLHGTPTISNLTAILVSMTSNFTIALKTRLFESMPHSNRGLWLVRKAAHYFAVSGTGLVVNALSFQLLIRFANIPPSWSNLLAVILGMAANYSLAVTTKLVPIE